MEAYACFKFTEYENAYDIMAHKLLATSKGIGRLLSENKHSRVEANSSRGKVVVGTPLSYAQRGGIVVRSPVVIKTQNHFGSLLYCNMCKAQRGTSASTDG